MVSSEKTPRSTDLNGRSPMHYLFKQKRTYLFGLLVIGITTFAAAITTDAKLYYYGKHYWGFPSKLPFNIVPDFWDVDLGSLGFALTIDRSTIVAPGNQYHEFEPIVKEVIAYGFNDEKLVAVFKDSVEMSHTVEITSGPKNSSSQKMTFILRGESAFANDKTLKWIKIKGVSTDSMEGLRDLLLVVTCFLFGIPFLIWLSEYGENY